MSYDAIFLIPLSMLATLCGLLSVAGAAARPKQAPAERGLAAVWAVAVACAQPIALFGLMASSRRPLAHLKATGWQAEHVSALQTWSQSDAAASYLAWSLVPIGLAAIALLLATRGRRLGRWWLALLPTVVLPGLLIVKAALPWAMGLWGPQDPRWSLGYAEQWLDQGAQSDDGAMPCLRYLDIVRRIESEKHPSTVIQAVHRVNTRGAGRSCARVCAEQDTMGYFNPGMLEDLCFPER